MDYSRRHLTDDEIRDRTRFMVAYAHGYRACLDGLPVDQIPAAARRAHIDQVTAEQDSEEVHGRLRIVNA